MCAFFLYLAPVSFAGIVLDLYCVIFFEFCFVIFFTPSRFSSRLPLLINFFFLFNLFFFLLLCQVKRELAQLDMLREEVARIRRMNEHELPAIREARESAARPDDKSPPQSPAHPSASPAAAIAATNATANATASAKTTPVTSATATTAAAPSAATALRRAGSPVRSMSPVIAQRLRSFHGARGGPNTSGRESPAVDSCSNSGSRSSSSNGSSSSSNGGTSAPAAGNAPVRGRLTPPPGPRTVTKTGGRTSTSPSSTGRETPAPVLEEESSSIDVAATENQPQNAPRSMSPLIAQRMAAFHTQKT